MSYKSARTEALGWRDRALPYLTLGDKTVEDTWLAPATYGDIAIEPLSHAGSISAASAELENCARSYCHGVARNHRRLWGVRRAGILEAMVDLSRTVANGGAYPRIVELRGRQNRNPTYEVEYAVCRWWIEQPRPTAERLVVRANGGPDRAAWVCLWRPYWISKARLPAWLPLQPDWAAFWDI
jgi:hypothetical protein